MAAAFAGPSFDHLLFTGSTAVGRKVMAAAAAHLTPLTLELGGKSPAIVTESWPLQKRLATSPSAKMVNAGQTCIAPITCWCAPSAQTAGRSNPERDQGLLSASTAGGGLFQPRGNWPGTAGSGDCSGKRGRRRGADLRQRPSRPGRTACPDAHSCPQPESPIMQEEIFGPVLPIMPYETLEEAIRFIRSARGHWALYLFSGDRAEQAEVLPRPIPAM